MRTRTLLITSLLALASPLAFAANEAPPEQDDGGSGTDAASTCQSPFPVLETTDTAAGHLYPPQDKVDFYGLNVSEADVGFPVEVALRASSFEMYVDVFMPDCGGNVIADSPACERASRCVDGHKSLQGKGHETCAPGHRDDPECDSEQGSGDEWQVTFTPSRAGVYGIRVAVAPNADEPGRLPPGDYAPQNCHQFCFGYDVDTAGGEPAPVIVE